MKCAVETCARVAHAKALCMSHYVRDRRGLPLDAPLKAQRPRMARKGLCAGPGCTRLVVKHGQCQTHYLRSLEAPERYSQPLPLRRGHQYHLNIPADVAEAARMEQQRRGIDKVVPILREWMAVGHAHWLEARRQEALQAHDFGRQTPQRRRAGGAA